MSRLYYRLKVVQIAIPPLRARGGEEIETLARHFASLCATRYGRPEPRFDPEALTALRAHAWPGNVRELSHFVESAIALSTDGSIAADVVPPSCTSRGRTRVGGAEAGARSATLPLGLTLEEVMQRCTTATLDAAGGNKTEAARTLGSGRNRIARPLKR